jgi:hypothetical protein
MRLPKHNPKIQEVVLPRINRPICNGKEYHLHACLVRRKEKTKSELLISVYHPLILCEIASRPISSLAIFHVQIAQRKTTVPMYLRLSK